MQTWRWGMRSPADTNVSIVPSWLKEPDRKLFGVECDDHRSPVVMYTELHAVKVWFPEEKGNSFLPPDLNARSCVGTSAPFYVQSPGFYHRRHGGSIFSRYLNRFVMVYVWATVERNVYGTYRKTTLMSSPVVFSQSSLLFSYHPNINSASCTTLTFSMPETTSVGKTLRNTFFQCGYIMVLQKDLRH